MIDGESHNKTFAAQAQKHKLDHRRRGLRKPHLSWQGSQLGVGREARRADLDRELAQHFSDGPNDNHCALVWSRVILQ